MEDFSGGVVKQTCVTIKSMISQTSYSSWLMSTISKKVYTRKVNVVKDM